MSSDDELEFAIFAKVACAALRLTEDHDTRWLLNEDWILCLNLICLTLVIHQRALKFAASLSNLRSLLEIRAGIFSEKKRKRGKYPPVVPEKGVMAGLYGGNWRLLGNILPSQSSLTIQQGRTGSRWRVGRGCRVKRKESGGSARRSGWV